MAYNIFIENIVSKELSDRILSETRFLKKYADNFPNEDIKKLSFVADMIIIAFEKKDMEMLKESYKEIKDWEDFKLYRISDSKEKQRVSLLVQYLDAICN